MITWKQRAIPVYLKMYNQFTGDVNYVGMPDQIKMI